ncbi:protein kinase [Agromyces endophyticus]|uniref:serine/threonine-protein kinase n=1 Tax=Agromyces sp. H17E-10 TaxID=2932244 RepID=UPI001FD419A7|nr:serine/threonine-protein kinase [Agromyces sp. H17E-10]UOQ87689.1 protein kinase [Agromyces sp. H17E-10]
MTSTHDPGADPFLGTVLGGRYRIDALIGRGGMASVYRATDGSLGRPVAVKLFDASAEGIDDSARRASEIALLASLQHRALVRLYDASRDAGTGREYLVMELVDGQDLREALRSGPLDAPEAAALLADLGEALHVIHERGIVHRDVKPANVLLEPAHLPSRRWNAKLADFGIARLIDDARLTRTGLLVGTPGYLSPEQVSGAPAGPAADVYSLGLLALEARTGQAAFPGPAAEAAGARLVRDPEVPERLGADWVALLSAMTARDPQDRPSGLEVAVAAAGLDVTPTDADAATGATKVMPVPLGGATAATAVMTPAGPDPAGPDPAGPVGPARPADAPPRRRRPVLIVAALAAAAVAIVLLAHAVIGALTTPVDAEHTPSPSAPVESTTPSEEPTVAPAPPPDTDDAPGNSGSNRNDDKGDDKDKGKGGGKGKD